MFIRFVYGWSLYITMPLILLITFYRLRYYQPITYSYPLASSIATYRRSWVHTVLFFLRLFTLCGLAVFIAQPQLVDQTSQITVEGVDIMMVLDVSGSMRCFDDLQNQQRRIEIARQEALHFVSKRTNDPIGLVLFGQQAVCRAPLTADKKLIHELIDQVNVGILGDDGTMLARAITVAAARLRQSPAKSKVIILLTDGQPSPGDSDPRLAVKLARELGIRIYTIGVGGQVGYIDHPFGVMAVNSSVNTELLSYIAQETGGHYFQARNADELRSIYDYIDTLEKTEHQAPILSNYYDFYIPFVCAFIIATALEVLLASLGWVLL